MLLHRAEVPPKSPQICATFGVQSARRRNYVCLAASNGQRRSYGSTKVRSLASLSAEAMAVRGVLLPYFLAGGGAVGVRRLMQRGRVCGQVFPDRDLGGGKQPGYRALSAGSDTRPASGEAGIPLSCASLAAQSARRPNLDFGRDCLVRDAVRSELCSSLFLRDFPVFERFMAE